MNINFKAHFPWPGADGKPEPTRFAESILMGLGIASGHFVSPVKKLHTIRRVKREPRYREGMKLVLPGGTRYKPQPFVETECTGTQILEMHPTTHGSAIGLSIWVREPGVLRPPLHPDRMRNLALNDGFTSLEQFLKWFLADVITNGPGFYQVVHWTDVRY